MLNLSFDELRLIVQIRNISDFEKKSKEDLIKALSEPEPKPKPETKPDTKLEPERKPKPETKPKPEITVNKRKLKKLSIDFDKLRQVF